MRREALALLRVGQEGVALVALVAEVVDVGEVRAGGRGRWRLGAWVRALVPVVAAERPARFGQGRRVARAGGLSLGVWGRRFVPGAAEVNDLSLGLGLGLEQELLGVELLDLVLLGAELSSSRARASAIRSPKRQVMSASPTGTTIRKGQR